MGTSLTPLVTLVRPRADACRDAVVGLERHFPAEGEPLLFLGTDPGWAHVACLGTVDGRLFDCFEMPEIEAVPAEEQTHDNTALGAIWWPILAGPALRPRLTRLYRRDVAADARWPFSHWRGHAVHYIREGAEHGLVVVADHTGVLTLAIPADLRVPTYDPAAGLAGLPVMGEIDFPPFTVVRPYPASSTWCWREETPEGRAALARQPLPIRRGDQVLWVTSLADETGHCAVMTMDDTVVWALHPGEFEAVPAAEVSAAAAAASASWRARVRDSGLPRGSIVVAPELPRETPHECRLYIGQEETAPGVSSALVATGTGQLERIPSLLGYHVVREMVDDDMDADGQPVQFPRLVVTAEMV
jgi:hypothetical protein